MKHVSFDYMSGGWNPTRGRVSFRRIVLESNNYEVVDGVLYHESPTFLDQYCVVVPSRLRESLEEAHKG